MSLLPLQNEGIKIVWKPWKLPEGANPPTKPEGYGEQAKEYLAQLLNKLGLDMDPPSQKRSTLLAHIGAKFANEKNVFDQYNKRIFEAVWKYNENIENPDQLISIAQEVGLDPQDFQQALADERYKERVESDLNTAREMKIWTIPSYIGSKGVIQVHHFKDLPSIEEIRKII